MSKVFDIKVEIRDDLKKGLIFGLNSRAPIGLIIGMVGYSHEITPVLQSLSHSTRAFIWNADCLPGFVHKKDFK